MAKDTGARVRHVIASPSCCPSDFAIVSQSGKCTLIGLQYEQAGEAGLGGGGCYRHGVAGSRLRGGRV